MADSLAVIATSLVIIIAATDASGSLKVAWAAPPAAAAFALRRIVHRSWPGLVACLLSANAVAATVEVWLEPTRGITPQIILTVFATSAVIALAVAALPPDSVLGRRMLTAGDYIAAATIPIYFLALSLKGALGADGAAASFGLKMDAVAYFALSIMVAVYWGIFVLLRLAVPPPPGCRLMIALVSLNLPISLSDGIAGISANHVLGLPTVLVVTVAVTFLLVAIVQQARMKAEQKNVQPWQASSE